jgi:hypothetical protein
MRIVHRDEGEPAPEDDLKFTGRVERRDLLPPQQHAGLRLGWVRFELRAARAPSLARVTRKRPPCRADSSKRKGVT